MLTIASATIMGVSKLVSVHKLRHLIANLDLVELLKATSVSFASQAETACSYIRLPAKSSYVRGH